VHRAIRRVGNDLVTSEGYTSRHEVMGSAGIGPPVWIFGLDGGEIELHVPAALPTEKKRPAGVA
jgi:hypothetical protein